MTSVPRARTAVVAAGAGLLLAVPVAAHGQQTVAPRTPGTIAVDPPTDPLTTLADRRITESSGLAASVRRDDVVWTHGDRGNPPELYAVALATGETVATVRPAGLDNVDWEDVAAGPGPDGEPALWVADTGDNDRSRASVALHVVPEPVLPDDVVAGDAPALELEVAATSVDLVFPDEPRNVEALLVTPAGEVTLVSKEPQRAPAVVYAAPPLLRVDEPNALRRVGQLDLASPPPPTNDGRAVANGRFLPTAGAVAPDGRAVAVRTYGDVLVWPLDPGRSVAETLVGTTPTRFLLPPTEMGEGLAFAADGRTLLTSSEGVGAPLHAVPMPEEAGLDPFVASVTATAAPLAGRVETERPATAAEEQEASPEDAGTAPVFVAVLGAALVAAGIAVAGLRRRRPAP